MISNKTARLLKLAHLAFQESENVNLIEICRTITISVPNQKNDAASMWKCR